MSTLAIVAIFAAGAIAVFGVSCWMRRDDEVASMEDRARQASRDAYWIED